MTQLIEYTTKHYSAANDENMKVLRRRLIQAGIYDPRARRLFLPRRAPRLASVSPSPCSCSLPCCGRHGGSFFWLVVIVGGIAGYVGPSLYIDRRIAARKVEHRSGFPDFMDLLVVCADSGLSMEASLERVGRELGDTLSVAHRQHPYDQSGNPRRPHAQGSARAFRRPARRSTRRAPSPP